MSLKYLIYVSDKESTLTDIYNRVLKERIGVFLTAFFEGDRIDDYQQGAHVLVYFKPSLLDLVDSYIVRKGEWSKQNRGKRYTPQHPADLSSLRKQNHCITIPFHSSKPSPYAPRRIQTMRILSSIVVKMSIRIILFREEKHMDARYNPVALAHRITQSVSVTYRYTSIDNYFQKRYNMRFKYSNNKPQRVIVYLQ
jgi:hypothetical protein